MIFDDDTDDIMDEMAVARKMMARKDKLSLANEYIKALISDELSISGFENEQLCNLCGLRDALKVHGFVMSLKLGQDEPELTIRIQRNKQGRKRKQWIDRR